MVLNLPVCRERCRFGRGFSLVEALIAVAILGFSAAGISALLIAGMKQNELSGRYMLAANLGQDLMDEILAKPFYDPDSPSNLTPGPEVGENSRELLDNIDDYDGLVEPAGNMQLPTGSRLNSPNLSGFSRTASAQYVYLPGQDAQADPTFILVAVQVLEDSMGMIELKRLISSTEQEIP